MTTETIPPRSGYTSHGHPYGPNPPAQRPTAVARCGGPPMCRKCRAEVEALTARPQAPDPAELHPAAKVVRDASPRGGAYVNDDDCAAIAAAVLRWLANKVEVEADWQRRDPRHERHAYVIGVPRLYDLADEIEATGSAT